MMTLTWDYYKKIVNSVDGLSETNKEEYKEALEFIQTKIFNAKSSDIIYNVKSDNVFEVQYLIIGYIINLVPWSKIWIIQFKKALTNFLKKKNWNDIINEIKNPKNFKDRLFEINIGDSFLEGGFSLECHPPIINEKNKVKNPDFKIIDFEGQEYFVELKRIAESDQSKSIGSYMDSMTKKLDQLKINNIDCIYCGQFNLYPSEQTINEINDKIKEIVKKITETKFEKIKISIAEVIIFKFAIASNNNINQLYEWSKENSLQIQSSSYIASHQIHVDELHRINREIYNKLQQLPPDKPNILVFNSDLFFRSTFDDDNNLKLAIIQLQQFIQNHDKILFCIITGCSISQTPKNKILDEIPNTQFMYDNNGVFHRYILIIENQCFKDHIDNNSKNRITDAIKNGKRL